MENASKALLIAAGILVVILLIAFGVGIFNTAKESGDASGASTAINAGISAGVTQLQQTIPGVQQ